MAGARAARTWLMTGDLLPIMTKKDGELRIARVRVVNEHEQIGAF